MTPGRSLCADESTGEPSPQLNGSGMVCRDQRRYRRRIISAFVVIFASGTLSAIAGWPGSGRSLSDKLRSGPGVSNHPVGVVPSSAVQIPDGWPLQADGTISCVTCHTKLPSFGGRSSAHLRSKTSQGFCSNCHTDSNERNASGMHWRVMGHAHIQSNEDGDKRRTLDMTSRRCLECHDGVTASATAYQTNSHQGGGSMGDRSRNHPVGVAYPHAGKRNRGVPLRPAAMLPATVRLPGGSVGCVSCHDLYNSSSAHLSVPIEGSQLCMTCHEMD